MNPEEQEEKRAIYELSPEELLDFEKQKKDNVTNLKTLVIGKKDSGKSTIICNLLEMLDFDLRALEESDKTKPFDPKSFTLSNWVFNLYLNELNPDIPFYNFPLESYKIFILVVNDGPDFSKQISKFENELQRLQWKKSHLFETRLFFLFINNIREEKMDLKNNKSFDEKNSIWSVSEEKIMYFYEDFKNCRKALLEIRSKIIFMAEKKWVNKPKYEKETLVQRGTNSFKSKFETSKSSIDVSKSLLNTDKSLSKNVSCCIF